MLIKVTLRDLQKYFCRETREYVCSHCNERTKTAKALMKHLLRSCQSIPSKFNAAAPAVKKLKKNVQKKEPKIRFCPLCQAQVRIKTTLTKHKRDRHGVVNSGAMPSAKIVSSWSVERWRSSGVRKDRHRQLQGGRFESNRKKF